VTRTVFKAFLSARELAAMARFPPRPRNLGFRLLVNQDPG
jgi:hypothetical protein